MRRWFSGRLHGHYVGSPTQASAALHGPGEAFRFRIYRAVVRDLSFTADEPEPVPDLPTRAAVESPDSGVPQAQVPLEGIQDAGTPPEGNATAPLEPVRHHHTPNGRALYQPHIPQVHFVDALGPGRTIAAAAHDVLASELTFSHPTRYAGRAYGRVEARITGYFRPPSEPPPPPEEPAPDPAPLPVWSAREVRATRQDADTAALPVARAAAGPDTAHARAAHNGVVEEDPGASEADANDMPSDEPAASGAEAPGPTEEESPSQLTEPLAEVGDADPVSGGLPLFASAASLAIALLIFATPAAAAIWCGCFLPTYSLRRWLVGVVPYGGFIGLVGLLTGFFALTVAAVTVTGFVAAGCRTLSMLPLLTLVGAPILTAVMPRPSPYIACLLALYAVLLGYYGPLELPLCEARAS